MDERYQMLAIGIATLTGAWVMVDASRRGISGFASFALGLLTLLFCCIGLPLWLFLRDDIPEKVIPVRCPHCSQWTEGNEPVCRSCGATLPGATDAVNSNAPPWAYIAKGDAEEDRLSGCYDLHAQDLPKGAAKLEDVPNDFRPIQLLDHKDMVNLVRRAWPDADFSNPHRIVFTAPNSRVTLYMSADPVYACHFRVEGGEPGVEAVQKVLIAMKLPALNCIDHAIFQPHDTVNAYRQWLANRQAERSSTN